jgi:hypothetical protein
MSSRQGLGKSLRGPFASTESCGDERTRTADPLLAKQVLYQLSYVPVFTFGNFEPRPCTPLPQAKKDSTAPIADGATGMYRLPAAPCVDARVRIGLSNASDVVKGHEVALGTLPDNRERGSFHAGDTSPFPAFTVSFGRHTNASRYRAATTTSNAR